MHHLLGLPLEIRDQIYSYVLGPEAHLRPNHDGYDYSTVPGLLTVNRQIHHEAQNVFRNLNTFVCIASPFPESKEHVALEGCSIIASGKTADEFKQHKLSVEIGVPFRDTRDTFVILVEDLAKFCRSWFYSNVDVVGLNSNLTLKLTLRDPFAATPNTKRVTTALQKRLLLPFGEIKDLMWCDITGDPEPDETVTNELKRTMAKPMASPAKCLAEATRLKDEGNTHLQAGRYAEAVESYRLSWLAMHIVIKGTDRYVHGEHYFNRTLTEPPFENQEGGVVRLVLRLRLVSNTCLAYLKLRDHNSVITTGMRTIKLMRSGFGLDENEGASDATQEALTGFLAPAELGKIYFRTAMAFKAQDDTYEARKLLKVAALYLPNDKVVAKEMASVALRLY